MFDKDRLGRFNAASCSCHGSDGIGADRKNGFNGVILIYIFEFVFFDSTHTFPVHQYITYDKSRVCNDFKLLIISTFDNYPAGGINFPSFTCACRNDVVPGKIFFREITGTDRRKPGQYQYG